jgi:hypothetical protein
LGVIFFCALFLIFFPIFSMVDEITEAPDLIPGAGASMVVWLTPLAEKTQEIPNAETIYCLVLCGCRSHHALVRRG